MSNDWFVADLHFGHKNIVRACSDWSDKSSCRDFASVEEHDAYLLAKLNKHVKRQDTLRILGDVGFGFAWKQRFKELRSQIKCERIILILGNHDHVFERMAQGHKVMKLFKKFLRFIQTEDEFLTEEDKATFVKLTERFLAEHVLDKEFTSLFEKVKLLHFGKIAGRAMCLCHYAMQTWPWQHQGSIHLYGHSHGNLPDDPNSLKLDVGVDTCLYGHEKYTPYSAEEVFHIMDTYKRFVPLDHHA